MFSQSFGRRVVSSLSLFTLLSVIFVAPVQADVAPQADMDITDISVDASTNEVLYTAANLGTLDVDYTLELGYTGVYTDYNQADGSFADLFYYDWNTEMAAGSWAGTFFNAGGTETINSGIGLSEGEHTIMVCIERAALYGEMASGFDNCEIETFTVVGLYPDLLIESATYNPDTSVSFVVRNSGTADVDSEAAPYLNFYYDFINSDLSGSTAASTSINDHGTDYKTVGGATTVNTGALVDESSSCVLYILAVADGNGDLLELDDSNNEYRTTFDLCPGDGVVVNGFTVEAGVEEGIGISTVYNLAAYTEGASTLSSATVDWGDGSAIETPTQTLNGDRINLGASHSYDRFENFTVTVCANDASEEVCDTVLLHVVGNQHGDSGSSSVTLAGDTDEEIAEGTSDTTDTTLSPDSSGSEGRGEGQGEDQEVTLAVDVEPTDCTAMAFEDISADDEFFDALCSFWSADIVHGKTANSFDADDVIRRDEAAKIFTRLFGYTDFAYAATPVLVESSFVDVEASDPLAYYAELAVDENLLVADFDSVKNEEGESVEEGYFLPHEALTVIEFADALDQINEDKDGALEAEGYERADLVNKGYSDVSGTITRGGFLNLLIDFLQ